MRLPIIEIIKNYIIYPDIVSKTNRVTSAYIVDTDRTLSRNNYVSGATVNESKLREINEK